MVCPNQAALSLIKPHQASSRLITDRTPRTAHLAPLPQECTLPLSRHCTQASRGCGCRYDALPPPNASLAEPKWADAALYPGRVLDNLLVSAATDPKQRAAPKNPWERRARHAMQHGLPGDAERMRAHSLEALCSKVT